MTTPKEDGIDKLGRMNEKSAGAFWSVNLVGAEGNEIGVELGNRMKGDLAERLHRVGMKDHAPFAADQTKRRDRLNGAGLIVGGHDRNEGGVGADGGTQVVGIDESGGIHGQVSDAEALAAAEVIEAVKNGVVFDGGCDQVASLVAEAAGDTEDREIAAFGAAAGEDHLTGLATQEMGRPIPKEIQLTPGFATDVMDAGRIAKGLLEKRQHGQPHLGVERSGGVVVQIDRPHIRELQEYDGANKNDCRGRN